jgi:thioredoxin reductase (NADPH)
MVDVMYDVLIIGSGPAGCTAGIFSVRRNLKALVVSDPASLSQTEEATTIEDWPGDMGVHGIELAQKFRDHAKKLGVEFLEDKITDLKVGKSSVKIIGKKSYEGKTLIFATGARHRKGLVKGEDEFSGKGVSYCASCDAPFFKDKDVLVLGGGDSAVMYALLLDQVGARVSLVHRRDELRAAEAWQNKIKKSKVKVLWSTVALEIKGSGKVESAILMNKKTQKKSEVKVDGIFVAFGTVPTSGLARKAGLKLDERGQIIVDRQQKTNVTNVFAAGDCCNNPSKKIVTAAGDGAIAAESVYSFIKDQ